MSFPKAKLHRFNEEISCTPSPGKYDPKFDVKVKGAVIEKSKRFLTRGIHSSTESIDSTTSVKSTCSAKSVPVFRTPQLKRHVFTTPQMRSRSQSQSEKVIKSRGLKEEVNCEQSREEDKKLIENLNQKLNIERENYTQYIKELELKIQEIPLLRENLQCVIDEKNNLQLTVAEKNEIYDALNKRFVELENGFKKVIEENNEIVAEHEKQLKSIADAAEMNCEVLMKKVSDRVSNYIVDFDNALVKMQTDTEIKLCEALKDFEVGINKLENNIHNVLNNIKEMKNNVEKKTDEFTTSIKEADERSTFLYEELCKVERERDDLLLSDLEQKLTIIEIQEKCDNFEYYLKISREKCKKYEVSVSKMQETIKALSDRLFTSESEVERLNAVESELQLRNFSLEEKVTTLLQEKDDFEKNMESVEKRMVQDVMCVRNELLERLEFYKVDAQKEICHLKEEINIRDQDIVNKAERILDFTIKVDSLEESKKEADDLISILEAEKQALQVQLYEKENAFRQLQKSYEEKIGLPQASVHDLEERISKLEEEKRHVTDSLIAAQEENRELDQQIAQILGHQNIKQKIKHVEQLKQHNRSLKEEIERLQAELVKEKKKNKENSATKSPVQKKKHLQAVSSPNNTSLTVLKDRNQ